MLLTVLEIQLRKEEKQTKRQETNSFPSGLKIPLPSSSNFNRQHMLFMAAWQMERDEED